MPGVTARGGSSRGWGPPYTGTEKSRRNDLLSFEPCENWRQQTRKLGTQIVSYNRPSWKGEPIGVSALPAVSHQKHHHCRAFILKHNGMRGCAALYSCESQRLQEVAYSAQRRLATSTYCCSTKSWHRDPFRVDRLDPACRDNPAHQLCLSWSISTIYCLESISGCTAAWNCRQRPNPRVKAVQAMPPTSICTTGESRSSASCLSG